jgi:peptide deformylase
MIDEGGILSAIYERVTELIKEVLLLGNPKLYEVSEPVAETELGLVHAAVTDLHDTLIEYRRVHGAGRAIAAPQIGIQKRLLYMYIDKPVVFINPELKFPDDELMEVMDDCMSFPGLLVKVNRHKRCLIRYRDLDWSWNELRLEGDLSELLQHEYDHLDGVLATLRAIDDKSLFYVR